MERYEYLNGPPAPRMVAELAMRHDVLVKQLADAQATIAALEETILKMGENAAVVAKDAMAAKAQVAALQRERDKRKDIAELRFAGDHKFVKEMELLKAENAKLQTALDAERERYELLNVERNAIDNKRHVLHEQLANTIEAAAQQEGELAEIQALAANLKSQLTQLQALVRAAASAPGKDWLEWQLKLGEALNGICPKDRALANDANREMGLPDDEDWGDK